MSRNKINNLENKTQINSHNFKKSLSIYKTQIYTKLEPKPIPVDINLLKEYNSISSIIKQNSSKPPNHSKHMQSCSINSTQSHHAYPAFSPNSTLENIQNITSAFKPIKPNNLFNKFNKSNTNASKLIKQLPKQLGKTQNTSITKQNQTQTQVYGKETFFEQLSKLNKETPDSSYFNKLDALSEYLNSSYVSIWKSHITVCKNLQTNKNYYHNISLNNSNIINSSNTQELRKILKLEKDLFKSTSEQKELKFIIEEKTKTIEKLMTSINDFNQLLASKNKEIKKLKDSYLIDKQNYETAIKELQLYSNLNMINNSLASDEQLKTNEKYTINSEINNSMGNLNINQGNDHKINYNKPYNIPNLQLERINDFNSEYVPKNQVNQLVNPKLKAKSNSLSKAKVFQVEIKKPMQMKKTYSIDLKKK